MTGRPGVPAHMKKPYDLEDMIEAYNEGVVSFYTALHFSGLIDLSLLEKAFHNQKIPELETYQPLARSAKEEWEG